MRAIFLSYATDNFISARDKLCLSALKVGFDEVRPRGLTDLDPSFQSTHQSILSQARGAGYWLWKPQIILQELRTLADGEVLVYSDAGRSDYYRLRRYPQKLISLARQHGFLLGPTIGQHGPMAHWTKRDAFILLDMDSCAYHEAPPIQATWSIWTPTPSAFAFLEAWIQACSDPRILTDIENTQGLPNLPGFIDHRHDQSVLSLLAYKFNAKFLDKRNNFIERILLLRPKSKLSNIFMKRIDDAEALEIGHSVFALINSFFDSLYDRQ